MKAETKEKRYSRIYQQIAELIKVTDNLSAKLTTITAILHHKFPHFFWTGFYMLSGGELKIRCYQGPLACLVLEKYKGVCWNAVNSKTTIVVDDVHKFPGHIACDSRSNSEIVVPLIDSENICHGVLDIDSKDFAAFDAVDQKWLEKILELV
jgi:GAF domain-containing protein